MQGPTPSDNIVNLLEDRRQLSYICQQYAEECERLRRKLETTDAADIRTFLEQCETRLQFHSTELDFCRADLATMEHAVHSQT